MIEHLLAPIQYIGKKAAYGEGAVQRFQVEEASQDSSLWTAEGHLARPVPSKIVGDLTPALAIDAPIQLAYIAYRAPQWLPYNQTICALWS